jgi:hypothetical protein
MEVPGMRITFRRVSFMSPDAANAFACATLTGVGGKHMVDACPRPTAPRQWTAESKRKSGMRYSELQLLHLYGYFSVNLWVFSKTFRDVFFVCFV